MIESTIRAILLADAPVAALVSTRVYPMAMPQSPTLPAIVYQRISTVPGMNLDGTDDLGRGRVQLSLWASTFDGARALFSTVATALEGKQQFADGLALCRLINWGDDFEPGTTPASNLFRVIADFRVTTTQGVAA